MSLTRAEAALFFLSMASALLERFEMVGVAEKASDECLTKVLSNHYNTGFCNQIPFRGQEINHSGFRFLYSYSDEQSTLLLLSKQ